WIERIPAPLMWLPPSLAVRALAGGGAASIALVALATVQAGLLYAGGVVGLARQLEAGVVRAGARESGRAGHAPRRVAAVAAVAGGPAGARRWLGVVQEREVRLLLRDRNFLVQTLLLPLLVIGMQYYAVRG